MDAAWLLEHSGEPGLTVIDPRSRMRYLSGHVPQALSVPARSALGPDGRLLSDDELAAWLGRCGVPSSGTVVLYADADGQPGALLAWILSYLGHDDVRFVTTRFERWRDEGGQLAYKPTTPEPVTFLAKPRPELRASRQDVAASEPARLLDTRTVEEFTGDKTIAEDPPGHIPGARNIPHLSFQGEGRDLLLSGDALASRLAGVGLDLTGSSIAYCRSGMRASVAWLAMHLAGAPVSLYDGSFLDWTSREGAPVEA